MRITLIKDRGPPSRTSYVCFGLRIVCVHGIQQYSVRELRLVITLCVSAQTRMHEELISPSNQSDYQMTRNVWIYSFAGCRQTTILLKLAFYNVLYYQRT